MTLGQRIKGMRTARGMRISDLAAEAGCSESMISKIENDKGDPSLKTLHRLAAALGTSIGALFNQEGREEHVFRKGHRPLLAVSSVREGSGVILEALVPQSPGHLLQVNIHIVAPGGSTKGTISHDGEEVGYILEGELDLVVENETHRLRSGDSFLFNSSLPHGYSNPGGVTTKVLWINTPPTF